MITHKVGIDEIDENDLTVTFANQGVVEMWYEYEIGCYEGMGYAVVKFEDGTFDLVDLSHCSCYGPGDNWARIDSYTTLDQLKGSAEYFEDASAVIKASGIQ